MVVKFQFIIKFTLLLKTYETLCVSVICSLHVVDIHSVKRVEIDTD